MCLSCLTSRYFCYGEVANTVGEVAPRKSIFYQNLFFDKCMLP